MFIKNLVVKNIVVLIGGGISAQLITMLSLPIIVRLYGPDVYGQFSIISSMAMVFSAFLGFSLPIALLVEKDKNKVSKIIDTIAKLLLLWLIFGVLVVAPFFWIAPESYTKNIGNIFTALVMGIVMVAFQVVQNSLNIQERYLDLGKLRVLNAAISSGLKILAGLFIVTVSILVASHILLMLTFSFILLSGYFQKNFLLSVRLGDYSDFIINRSSQETLNAISQAAPVLFVGFYFGDNFAAFVGMAIVLLSLPSTMIATTVNNLLYPKLKTLSLVDGTRLVRRIFIFLALLGSLTFGLMLLIIDPLVLYVFGPGWEVTGYVVFWFGLSYVFQMANKPHVALCTGLNLQHVMLENEVLGCAAKCLLIIVILLTESPFETFIKWYGCLALGMYFILIWKIERGVLRNESPS